MKIAVIDYGMGNIHSVNKALQLFGAETLVTNKADEISGSDKAVLPGVGAFDDAMEELEKEGLDLAIRDFVKSGKPLMGICLGLQLFFQASQEAKTKKGLGLVKGSVQRFTQKKGLKVPHMGWNQLTGKGKNKLFDGIAQGSYVYFCHSYYPVPEDPAVIAASCEYGQEFCSAIAKDNLYGVQFHPEKSQKIGLKILENFVKAC